MTLSVDLTNFRIHNKASFTFSEGITQLSAISGRGKSTIVHAIRWCLYGGLHDICPRGKPHAKVRVILTYRVADFIVTVTRSTNPGKVAISEGERTWYGDEACATIEQFFGSETLWFITNYLAQQSLHPFVSYGPTELSNSFASLIDNTTQRDTMNSLHLAQQMETRDLNRLSGFSDVKVCECPPTEKKDTAALLRALEDAQGRTSTLRATMERLSLASRLATLKQEADQITVTQSVKALESELQLAKQYETSSEHRRLLESRLRPRVLEYDIAATRAALVQTRRAKNEGERCPVPYDRMTIDSEKKRLRELATLVRREETMKSSLSQLIIPEHDSQLREKIEEGEQELVRLESECSVGVGSPCPSCGVVLSLVGGTLKQGSLTVTQHAAVLQERDKVRATLKRDRALLENVTSTTSRRESLMRDLAALRTSLPSEVPDDLFQQQSIMESIIFYEAPHHTEEELQQHLDILLLEEELAKLPLLQRRVLEVEVDLQQARRRDALSREVASLGPCEEMEPHESIEDIERELSLASAEESKLMEDLKVAEAMNATHAAHSECAERRKGLEEYKVSSTNIQRLTIATSEHTNSSEEHLASTLERINSHLLSFSRELYKKDIVLRLVSRRRGQKAVVEMVVFYDGIEASIGSLSGGEKKRASIVTLLALIAHKQPLFVVLDEPFGDNEDTWEEAMLDLIKSHIVHIPCIIMHHGSMGSAVDNVIHL